MVEKLQTATVPETSEQRDRFQYLFEEHYRAILAYSLRRTQREADAEDVVSETFSVAWHRIDRVPEGKALPWLYGVARRCLANQQRQSQRQSRTAHEFRAWTKSASEDGPPAGGSSDRLHVALGKLRHADRELLQLVAWEGLSHEQVAIAIGISANAVGIRMHRARSRLRKILGDEDLGTPALEKEEA